MNGSARTVRFADGGTSTRTRSILATGVSYRQLAAPGLDELTGRGVFYGSALTEAPSCAGQDVYIVGGANSAGQAAVYLSRYARSVTMLVRGPSLDASMSYYLIQQIAQHRRTSRCGPTPRSSAATATSTWSGSRCATTATGETETVDAQLLFVFIGAAPRTDWLDGVVRPGRARIRARRSGPGRRRRAAAGWSLDRAPYHLETSVPGVFAPATSRRVGQAGRLGGR